MNQTNVVHIPAITRFELVRAEHLENVKQIEQEASENSNFLPK